MAAVHGQIMLFQLWPNGPNIARMNTCMETARISETRRYFLVSNPTPKPIWMNGAAIPKAYRRPRAAGKALVIGSTIHGKS